MSADHATTHDFALPSPRTVKVRGHTYRLEASGTADGVRPYQATLVEFVAQTQELVAHHRCATAKEAWAAAEWLETLLRTRRIG